MTSVQDRPELVRLLEQLGSEDEGLVLQTAREIHRRVVVEGEGWQALIPEGGPTSSAPFVDERPPSEATSSDATISTATGEEDNAILERLLRRTDISDETREELEGLRSDMESGDFTRMDSDYLRALDGRLGAG